MDLPTLTPIKTLSLWQPWASLIMAGFKLHETRHWSTTHRGPLAIHAAKTIDRVGAPAHLCAVVLGRDWWDTLPAGALLGVADLTGVFRTEQVRRDLTAADRVSGNFGPDRFAWRLDGARELVEPIPMAGRQGLFNWTPPADLEARLGSPVDHYDACRRLGFLRAA